MKKYMKLIGSLMIMMCMAAGIIFAVTDSQASEETRLWLLPEGNTINAEDPYYTLDDEGIPSYDGYLFAGYYVGNSDGYTAVKSIEGMTEGTYYAKFVPEGVLGIKAQVSGNILKDEVSDTTKNMIRFVTSIDDSLDYQKVGFKINVGGYANIDAEVDEWVYKTIYAVGATSATTEIYDPSIFDPASAYFKTWTFTEVPEDYLNTDITVTPYWVTKDGTTVEGTTAIRTANYCRGWFYVNSSATSDAITSPGTFNSPATLATAVAIPVNTELVTPKVYLQNDITLDAQVTVGQSMTITSLDTVNKSTIKRVETLTTGDGMICVSGANTEDAITVNIDNVIIDGTGTAANVRALAVGESSDDAVLNINYTTIQNFVSSKQGGSLQVRGTVNLNNSTIKDGSSTNSGGMVNIDSGTLNLNSGLIGNGTTSVSGGCVRVNTNAELYIIGGTIESGKASSSSANNGNGGNIWCAGTIIMTGGTVQNGTATTQGNLEKTGCGGNIYLNTNGSLVMTGGTISGGKAKLSESTITKNNGFGGGNIFSHCSSVDISKNAVIKDGESDNRGGNIYMYGASNDECVLDIKNSTVDVTISGGNAYNGGNIFANRCTTTIEKIASISGGEASYRGGNMYIWGGSLAMSNATVSGGNATNNGGNMVVEGSGVSMTLNNGAVISGGISGANGGNMTFATGALTMNAGSQIINGQAKTGGNVYVYASATAVNVAGGKITDGKASSNYNNLFLAGDTITFADTVASDTEIFVSPVNNKVGTLATNAKQEYLDNGYIILDSDTNEIVYADGKLTVQAIE